MLRLTTLVLLALTAQQAPPSTAIIVGRVLDQSDGKAISSAVVEVFADSSAPSSSASAFPARRQMTDALGRFVFREMPGGQFLLRVTVGGTGFSPNGFIQTGGLPIGAYLEGGYGQRRPGGSLQPLLLAEGQAIPDLVVQLWRAAAISGIVIDDTGEPVVDTVVGAVRVSSDGRLINGPTVRTDDRGAYRLSALLPGRYIVFVPQTATSMSAESADELTRRVAEVTAGQKPGAPAAPVAELTGIRIGDSLVRTASTGLIDGSLMPRRDGNATFVFETTFYPAATALGSAASIDVTAGDDRSGIDVSVRPVRAAAVSGTLLAGGVPASGVRLRLAPVGSADASLFETAVAQTDGLGRFTFPLVPIGNYVLNRVNDPSSGRSPSGAVLPNPSSAVGPGAWLSESVGVPTAGVGNLVFTLKPGFIVKGQLEFSGAAPRPSDADLLKLVIGVRSVSPRARADAFGGGSESVSFSPGNFATSGLPPGRYVFRASGTPAGLPWRVQSVTIGGREVNDMPFDVTEDVNVRVVFTDHPAGVSGHVTSSEPGDGAAAVLLFPADRSLWPDARALTRRVRLARTSASGDFNISDVPPGDYLAIAMPDTDTTNWPDLSFLTKIFAQAQSVKIGAGERPTVPLTMKRIQ